MKGIEILSIALIGFIVITLVLFWSISHIGITRQSTVLSREISEADSAISEIESSKRSLKDALELTSNFASLQIAAAGGSYGGERLWWCNGRPVPPEPVEVVWSMSNKTSSLFSIYMGRADTILESDMKGYECVKVQYPEECRTAECIFWNSTALAGNISYQGQDLKVIYDGNIATDAKPNRFWWIYLKLYEYAKKKPLVLALSSCITDTTELKPEIDKLLQEMMKELEALFDGFVKCSYEYECGPSGAICTTECPKRFDLQLCHTPQISFAANQAQALDEGSTTTKVAIKCTDQKYRIPDEKKFKELTWIIKASIEARYEICPYPYPYETPPPYGTPPPYETPLPTPIPSPTPSPTPVPSPTPPPPPVKPP